MKSKELVNIILSPQWTSKLIHHFLSGAMRINSRGVKTELLYLILPLLIDDDTRKMIKNNISSSFSTTFFGRNSSTNDNLLRFKNMLSRKNEQIIEYKKFTNRGLIYLANFSKVSTGKSTLIMDTIRYQDEPIVIRDYCKAAHYLGVIFAKEDYKNIFLKLGITNL